MSAAVLSFTGQAVPEHPGIYPPQQAHEHPIDGAGPASCPPRPPRAARPPGRSSSCS